jgi:hypothetical protein
MAGAGVNITRHCFLLIGCYFKHKEHDVDQKKQSVKEHTER